MVASDLPGLNTTVLVQATQVLQPRPALRRRVASTPHRLAMRARLAAQPTTLRPGESLWTHHTTRLHHLVLHRKRITRMYLLEMVVLEQATPARMLVAQPALLMCPWLREGHHNSVNRHARRVRVLQGSPLSSTAQAMTLRLKMTPLPRLLTLHRRIPSLRRPISPLIPSRALSLVLRRHPLRLADSSRMAYPTKLQARPAKAATLCQMQQTMLKNQQCMPTISLPLLPEHVKKCPLLFILSGETTNTTKAPTRSLDGLFRPLFLPSNGAIRPLNAPG
jgi:hypothetical protein